VGNAWTMVQCIFCLKILWVDSSIQDRLLRASLVSGGWEVGTGWAYCPTCCGNEIQDRGYR
jgi:hypothetical protein